MAKYMIARQLSGKKIVTNEGEEFGKLIDIDIDEVSGRIEYLIVEPNPDHPLAEKMPKEDDGYVLVPYEAVMAIGDYILVDKKHLYEA